MIESLGLSERVRLLGPVADVPGVLSWADLSVFSSRDEGTPNAVLESMAAGRAVVATDIPGCRDALGDDYPALTCPGDAEAMATAILEMAENPQRRNELGQMLHQRVAAKFSIEQMCRRTCEILESLI